MKNTCQIFICQGAARFLGRIQIRYSGRIRIRNSDLRIRGSGSITNNYGSGTLLKKWTQNNSVQENSDANLQILESTLKSININLEESNNESQDYKKLSLTKLRSIVAEKGLSADTSKLKKQDLLKLLEDE
jgi:hypothetical protein